MNIIINFATGLIRIPISLGLLRDLHREWQDQPFPPT